MLRTTIESILQSSSLTDEMERCLTPWADLPQEPFVIAAGRVADMREQFQRVLEDITDPEQIEPVVALMYAQTRSQWEMANIRVIHQTHRGAPHPAVLYEARLLRALLRALEEAMPIATTENLNTVLRNPLVASEQLKLVIELGTASPAEIIEETRRWKDELADMTYMLANQAAANDAVTADLRSQLSMATADIHRMEANQANLKRELNTWESSAIIGSIRTARQDMARLVDRMLILESNQAILERELGAADAIQIAATMRKLSAENAALRGLVDLFGAMEKDLEHLELH
ncbi:hypothetical protein CCAX7_36930 [Capsulimonas corticalis]|uniref:Uncharacterized protein n=1 Tax=Capsulimonas corticalis TaxID=2219043 RepID=A0A402D190_9BACT|nr:hypothetical protein [Capsulimonas corticalis]BDI31642.1 hypothetical protein CCAX7_36930 [Capsulimonas corticalis]